MSKSNKIIAGLGVAAALGVAAMPLAGAFAVTGNVTVKYTIPENISMKIDTVEQDGTKTKVYDSVTNLTADGDDDTYSSTVEVATNAATGYNLTVKSDGANANLFNGNSGNIAPFAAEVTNLSTASAGWGLKITSFTNKSSGTITPGTSAPAADAYQSDFTTTGYNGVSTSDKIVLKSGTLSATVDDTTIVNYGVKAAADQPAGTYQDTLTYTAVVNS